MRDDLERLRRLRPDRLQPEAPIDPELLRGGKERRVSAIAQPSRSAAPAGAGAEGRRTPATDAWRLGEQVADIQRRDRAKAGRT